MYSVLIVSFDQREFRSQSGDWRNLSLPHYTIQEKSIGSV
jgi:hypothetical protein